VSDLPDELWSIHELATYFKLSERSVYNRVINQDGFPPALKLPGLSRRWVPEDVKHFVNRACEQAPKQSD
jgi:predicted DNA-binding transcriptional regulator AlpA